MRRALGKRTRSQAALDFMASYGIAIIIIIIAIAAIGIVTTSGKQLFSQECAGSSGFACGPYFLNTSGALNITLAQDTGGDITIYGLSCSSAISAISANTMPAYGNLYVTNSISYYPTGASPGAGKNIYTGGTGTFRLYCYDSSGLATSTNDLGNDFVGYLWANYSLPGQTEKVTQPVVAIDAKHV